MVVNTPKAPYDIAAYGSDDYFAINHKITGICSKYGADYYDFNPGKTGSVFHLSGVSGQILNI